MNFLNLQYFLVVAEELSITKAARRLYITQQSLSIHIQKLEEYFGSELFLRTTPLTLTPSGVYLCRKARELLLFRDNLKQELKDIEYSDRGLLTVGSTHSRAKFQLPAAIRLFRHKFPNIQIQLFEGTTPQVEDQLHKGNLDLSIGFLPSDASDINSIPLYDEKFYILIPVSLLDELLPEQKEAVLGTPEDQLDIHLLKDLPFLNLTPDTKLSSIFRMYMEEQSLTPTVLFETPNIETLIAMSYEGIGISICPETFIRHSYYDLTRFKMCPIDAGYARRSIVINCLSNRYLSMAAQEFIEIAKTVLR